MDIQQSYCLHILDDYCQIPSTCKTELLWFFDIINHIIMLASDIVKAVNKEFIKHPRGPFEKVFRVDEENCEQLCKAVEKDLYPGLGVSCGSHMFELSASKDFATLNVYNNSVSNRFYAWMGWNHYYHRGE